jgi:hypothetical protein
VSFRQTGIHERIKNVSESAGACGIRSYSGSVLGKDSPNDTGE